jgi:hypothetical protein
MVLVVAPAIFMTARRSKAISRLSKAAIVIPTASNATATAAKRRNDSSRSSSVNIRKYGAHQKDEYAGYN